MEEQETSKDNIADSDIHVFSKQEGRTQKESQTRRTRIDRATTLLDSGENLAGAGSSSRKEAVDTEVARVTAEYMDRARNDHMEAAGLWFERQEQKRDEPWPELERGEVFIAAMKKDILDPVALRRQLEEEEEEEAKEEERRSKRRPRKFRQPRRGKVRGGSSSSLRPRPQKAGQEGSLLTAPEEISGDPGPEPLPVIPANQPASSATSEDVGTASAPTNTATPLPTQPGGQGPPPETPKKRKRSMAAEILEVDRK